MTTADSISLDDDLGVDYYSQSITEAAHAQQYTCLVSIYKCLSPDHGFTPHW